ncbi:hypothetical protein EC973_005053 [Apophysomyces ossiformis]|uniref:Uncharacterized protein n=1 Tax=Apophysomyces ossiformis TaxID=679940 RepID=A0A8H7EUT9_9FUNG|nr:hypothetical protein EC973_005053 [Apophysomyces ossiformis]
MPLSFHGKCLDITTHAGYYRAVDWIEFTQYVVPTIVMEHFNNGNAAKALYALVQLVNLTMARVITIKDIQHIKRNVHVWYKYLLELQRKRVINNSVFTISQHYLQHIPTMIENLGPLPYTAAFAMERTIGEYHERVSCDGDKSVKAESARVLTESLEPTASELWGPFEWCYLGEFRTIRLEKLLYNYWAMYLETVGEIRQKIEVAARLWKSDGEVVTCRNTGRNKQHETVFAKFTIDVDVNRRSRAIKREPRVYFGEVLCFFQHKQSENSHLLTLVKIFSITLSKLGYHINSRQPNID